MVREGQQSGSAVRVSHGQCQYQSRQQSEQQSGPAVGVSARDVPVVGCGEHDDVADAAPQPVLLLLRLLDNQI